MRAKLDVEQKVRVHLGRNELKENHPTIASLTQLFISKGERDLQVANSNFNVGKKETNQLLKSAFYNWVIVIGYYAMFHAARGALAKLKVYVSEDNVHEAVLNGMYHYYVYSGKMEDKLFFLLEDAKKARDEAIKIIEKLEQARTKRGNVNYEVAQAVKEDTAKKILEDGKEFLDAMRNLVK